MYQNELVYMRRKLEGFHIERRKKVKECVNTKRLKECVYTKRFKDLLSSESPRPTSGRKSPNDTTTATSPLCRSGYKDSQPWSLEGESRTGISFCKHNFLKDDS